MRAWGAAGKIPEYRYLAITANDLKPAQNSGRHWLFHRQAVDELARQDLGADQARPTWLVGRWRVVSCFWAVLNWEGDRTCISKDSFLFARSERMILAPLRPHPSVLGR